MIYNRTYGAQECLPKEEPIYPDNYAEDADNNANVVFAYH
jgi:hypothetical protein